MKITENNSINPYPELVNKERAQYLLKKWEKVLNAPITTGPITAMLLESQEQWLDGRNPFDKKSK